MNQVMVSRLDLANLKEFAERVSGEWNGKTQQGEAMADCANEVIRKATELQTLLEELEQYDYHS